MCQHQAVRGSLSRQLPLTRVLSIHMLFTTLPRTLHCPILAHLRPQPCIAPALNSALLTDTVSAPPCFALHPLPCCRLPTRMCGIIGIFKHSGEVNVELYEGLLMLQHRWGLRV